MNSFSSQEKFPEEKTCEKVMQKKRRRRVPRQKAADAGNEKDEFVVEIKVGLFTFEAFHHYHTQNYTRKFQFHHSHMKE